MASTSEIRAAAEKPETSQKSAEAEIKTLTLKSSDEEEFIIHQSAAVRSETIKNMVEDGCTAGVIPLLNVEAKQLSQIILYLKKHADGALSRGDLSKFDKDFLSGESVGDILDCVLAANYLCISDLVDLLALKIADLIKDESVDQIRATFDIPSDDFLEAAEEQKIREEHAWAFQGIRHP